MVTDSFNSSIFLFILAIGLVIQFFIARAVAKFAAKKGLDYQLFFWLSFLVSWVIMLIVAAASAPKNVTPAAPSGSDNN